jgi:hypothetical protein
MTLLSSSPSGLSKKVLMSIDWISATAHSQLSDYRYASYPELHDWENWHDCTARNGYTLGARHFTGVTVNMNPDRLDMGVHTIYSGKALGRIRGVSGTNGYDILKHHVESGHNIARIDVALDFINCGLSVQDFVDEWESGRCKTRLRSANIVKSLVNDGYTLYIGSQRTRKKLVRIYDKGAETGTAAEWVRCELQLMGKPATTLSLGWLESGSSKDFLLRGILSVVDFPELKQWHDVFNGKESVKIGSESAQKGDTRLWLLNQVIPCLAKEILLTSQFWTQFKLMTDNEVIRLKGE